MADWPHARVEERDVAPGALWLIGAAFAILVAASASGLLLFFGPDPDWSSRRSDRPPPALQVSPAADYRAYLERKRAELHDRGWIDREAGLVEIPIDEAMRLVSRGHRAEAGPENAGCVGAACPAATPAARTIP